MSGLQRDRATSISSLGGGPRSMPTCRSFLPTARSPRPSFAQQSQTSPTHALQPLTDPHRGAHHLPHTPRTSGPCVCTNRASQSSSAGAVPSTNPPRSSTAHHAALRVTQSVARYCTRASFKESLLTEAQILRRRPDVTSRPKRTTAFMTGAFLFTKIHRGERFGDAGLVRTIAHDRTTAMPRERSSASALALISARACERLAWRSPMRGQQHPRLAGDRDALSRLAWRAPRLQPAVQRAYGSYARVSMNVLPRGSCGQERRPGARGPAASRSLPLAARLGTDWAQGRELCRDAAERTRGLAGILRGPEPSVRGAPHRTRRWSPRSASMSRFAALL